MVDTTPNLGLEEIAANTKTWTDRMNKNLLLIDAAVGAYFTLQNLQGIWENSRAYTVDQTVVDGLTAAVWVCQVAHTSLSLPSTFADDRAANSTYWTVYSSPARARGAWTGPGTSYAVNDFVVSGAQYAVCIAAHVSGLSFAADSSKWSILIDLSAAGSQVLPVPGGVADANKFVTTTSAGTGYTIQDATAVLLLLGTTTVGQAVLQAASAAAARTAIGAQVAGSYQTADATLTALSGAATQAYGIALLNVLDQAALRAAIGLGTAAYLNVGTAANNVVQMTAGAKLPAVDGTDLTKLPVGTSVQTISTTATTSISTTSSTYASVATLATSITPKTNTNKVRIEISLCVGPNTASQATFRIKRNGTVISSDPFISAYVDTANNSVISSTKIDFLDSPASAAAVSYTLEWKNADNVNIIYLNTNIAGTLTGVSTMTLTEIVA